MKDLTLELTNLTNREELTDTKLAQLKAQATIFDSGHATLNMSFDLLAKQPTFKLKSAITKVDLKNLNGFLMAYGKFEVDRGEFSLFNEIAAKNGHFVAYAKPIFRHIDVQAWEEKHHPNNKLLILWKNIVGFIFDRFKNKEKDQIAIKIKAEGSFEDPNINILQAVASLLRNGFIQALIPGYDNTIRWNDVPDDNSKEKESGKTPKS
jgi:hypothetical protein